MRWVSVSLLTIVAWNSQFGQANNFEVDSSKLGLPWLLSDKLFTYVQVVSKLVSDFTFRAFYAAAGKCVCNVLKLQYFPIRCWKILHFQKQIRVCEMIPRKRAFYAAAGKCVLNLFNVHSSLSQFIFAWNCHIQWNFQCFINGGIINFIFWFNWKLSGIHKFSNCVLIECPRHGTQSAEKF